MKKSYHVDVRQPYVNYCLYYEKQKLEREAQKEKRKFLKDWPKKDAREKAEILSVIPVKVQKLLSEEQMLERICQYNYQAKINEREAELSMLEPLKLQLKGDSARFQDFDEDSVQIVQNFLNSSKYATPERTKFIMDHAIFKIEAAKGDLLFDAEYGDKNRENLKLQAENLKSVLKSWHLDSTTAMYEGRLSELNKQIEYNNNREEKIHGQIGIATEIINSCSAHLNVGLLLKRLISFTPKTEVAKGIKEPAM